MGTVSRESLKNPVRFNRSKFCSYYVALIENPPISTQNHDKVSVLLFSFFFRTSQIFDSTSRHVQPMIASTTVQSWCKNRKRVPPDRYTIQLSIKSLQGRTRLKSKPTPSTKITHHNGILAILPWSEILIVYAPTIVC